MILNLDLYTQPNYHSNVRSKDTLEMEGSEILSPSLLTIQNKAKQKHIKSEHVD